MTNDEIRMTKECPKPEARNDRLAFRYSDFVIRHSFIIRISSFVIALTICWISWSATVVPTTSGPITDPEKAGQELVQKLRAMTPAENSSVSGVLKIRDREGTTREVPVSCQVVGGSNIWKVTYQAKVEGSAETLTIVHSAGQANEYLYTKPGASEPQKLNGQQAMIPFAGSDFWLADLGLEFLHWPKQRLLKTEMRKSRWCNVLQSDNPGKAGYARVVSWLDKESGGPIIAEGYNSAGKLLKEFSIKSLKKVEGRYELEEMEIRSEETKSRTRLEFNFDNKGWSPCTSICRARFPSRSA